MAWYLDTSAVLKLLVIETHSNAMRTWFNDHDDLWSSQLLRTEAHRAVTRLGVDEDVLEEVLADISLVLPSETTFSVAGRLHPAALRSLDALHLATAVELGTDLEGVVAYDRRVLAGARATSLAVLSPG